MLEFHKLEIPDDTDLHEKVKSILKARLPRSSHIFNMAQGLQKWTDRISFYTLSDDSNVHENSWIIAKLFRLDMGTGLAISPPPEVQITADIENAFSTGGLIDWTKQYHFPALDRAVSPMIMNISAFKKNNITRINPCYHFCLDDSDAQAFDVESVKEEGTIVRPLDLETGVDFVMQQWKYAMKGTDAYLLEIIQRNHTMGVYVGGKVVCGVVTHINGTIGGLNTLEEFRRRGYGQMCMKALMRQQSDDGLMPFSAAETSNEASIEFHKKLGMRLCGIVDYISSPWKDLAS